MLLPLAEIVSRQVLRHGRSRASAAVRVDADALARACSARRSPRAKASCSRSPPASSCRRAGSATVAPHHRRRGRRVIATILALGGAALVRSDRAAGDVIAVGVPVWVADLVAPGRLRADRRCGSSGARRRTGRAARSPRSASSPALRSTHIATSLEGQRCLPWLVAGARSRASLGAPIFALLGGIALFASLVARQSAGRAARSRRTRN